MKEERNKHVHMFRYYVESPIPGADGIENGIDARSHHEKASREKERAVKERGENEIMMQTQEGEPNIFDVCLIVKDNNGSKSKKQAGSSRSGNHTKAEDGKIGKDAAGIGNNVVGTSHDKDNIIEVSCRTSWHYISSLIFILPFAK
nr:hypothetical protein [Tanacetum cinerariifolium]